MTARAAGGRVRDPRIDALKGYAIILVVIGHAAQRAELFGLVRPFARGVWMPWSGYLTMPLFVMVSGYLIHGRVRRPEGPWLLGKARMLLVPWAAWTLLYYAVLRDPLIVTDMPLGLYLRSQLLSPSLWYLPVLFGCYVLMAAAQRLSDWSLPVIGLALLPMTVGWLPLLGWYWWWFSAGYLLARFRASVRRWVLPIAGLAVAAYAAAVAYSPGVTLGSRILFGLAGAALGYALIEIVHRFMPRAERLLGALGSRSLTVYTAQFLVVSMVVVASPWNILVTTIGAIVLAVAIDWLLSRMAWTRLIFLGGRNAPLGREPASVTA